MFFMFYLKNIHFLFVIVKRCLSLPSESFAFPLNQKKIHQKEGSVYVEPFFMIFCEVDRLRNLKFFYFCSVYKKGC
ncbi:hypothetical protein DDZ16_00175 [Marinilabilia rubra]|uniref:Uncharacterized protein n=1 Tax=Marinilabilia rubra TaxID=2162893 RepID=A0A2U2BCZ3_9BACT|nr:hypothetical protein DDZ16_00175 [Marinilabilia rubra]